MKRDTFKKSLKTLPFGWLILSLLFCLIVILPIIFLSYGLFSYNEPSRMWDNIRQFVLIPTIINTLLLVSFSVFFAGFIGTLLAVIFSMYGFKFKTLLELLLVLPLAIPPYIAAYTYGSFLSFSGPLQTFFRNQLGMNIARLSIMNMPGAIFIYTLTFYPYIYLGVRAYLKNNSATLIESARLLGKNELHVLWHIILPILKPIMISSGTLVALEIINDFGVAEYFGVRTLSVLIFQAWYGMFNIGLAIRISFFLIGFVILYKTLSRFLFNERKYQLSPKERVLIPIEAKGVRLFFIYLFPLVVLFFSLFIPVGYTISLVDFAGLDVAELAELTLNTLMISGFATLVIILFSLIISNTARFMPQGLKPALKLASIGYGVPSPVLAIAVLSIFVVLEQRNLIPSYLMGFTVVMLLFAYFIKYFSLGQTNVEKGYAKVGRVYTDSSRILGYGITKTFFKVDLFTIKNAIISASILVFVDLVKELPLTLILRSFNFQTLSTRVYMFAINEQIPRSAPFSLTIIFISSLFITLIQFIGRRNNA